ncbi:myozenin-3 [Carlito syrichta]|uniref:Myozenin-3 n=1 Tax=Carlito syrichta TaxID=1868482 RepID=A0A1U7TZP2_CARSF|nr:myozenin-3 [Carlito syrichta]
MIPKEQKGPATAAMGDFAGPGPSLDLGKKLSVPQDLMMEELSLRNNRGSLLFQKRQRRVQRFTFELAASQRAVSEPPLHSSSFESSAVSSLWVFSAKVSVLLFLSHLPTRSTSLVLSFSRTPVPFGGPLVGDSLPRAGTPFIPEPLSGLELLRLRPSFNRVAQGWVRHLPESEEL